MQSLFDVWSCGREGSLRYAETDGFSNGERATGTYSCVRDESIIDHPQLPLSLCVFTFKLVSMQHRIADHMGLLLHVN